MVHAEAIGLGSRALRHGCADACRCWGQFSKALQVWHVACGERVHLAFSSPFEYASGFAGALDTIPQLLEKGHLKLSRCLHLSFLRLL